jgi:CheY-like chemotaxis protein
MRLALVAAGNLFFVAKIDHGLAQAGVAREDVATAEAALAARRAGRGDLLILDLGHRGQDALDFLAAVKSDPAGRDLPVLAYVAHVDEARRARAEALGAERVVTQGELSAKLPRLLAEVLGQGTPRERLS